MTLLVCPHCGWEFERTRRHLNRLVPDHYWPAPFDALCPGSQQNPRNPDSDKRPLWKDEPAQQISRDRMARIIAELIGDKHQLEKEVARLQALVLSLADKLAICSAALTRCAERRQHDLAPSVSPQ